jgi:hypothetical protein
VGRLILANLLGSSVSFTKQLIPVTTGWERQQPAGVLPFKSETLWRDEAGLALDILWENDEHLMNPRFPTVLAAEPK